MRSPTLRFAPSPNGRLHLGHAYSALLNARLASQLGGQMLLRIEDIDTTRCTAELASACLEDLAWLGISWPEPVRVQSQHMADYAKALDRLKARGLVYPCFCTRSEIATASTAQDPDGAPIYPGTCKQLSEEEIRTKIAAGTPHSWRLDMQKASAEAGLLHYTRVMPETMETQSVKAQPERWGDAILVRKDTPTSYHLSVVVDDALQEITHVVRGQDLEAATCLHRLLQELLGLPQPLYHHHALIRSDTGDKLSKSKQHEALRDLREKGITPLQVQKMLGFAE